MAAETDRYVMFLETVERALEDALRSGQVPQGDEQREELEWMREEVARTRRALLDEAMEEVGSVAAAR